MSRPLKKDGTEDMRYADGCMDNDICDILKVAIIGTPVILVLYYSFIVARWVPRTGSGELYLAARTGSGNLYLVSGTGSGTGYFSFKQEP
jgi:hypothetical protein